TVTSTTGGCDTIYTINLTVSNLFTKTITPTICANQVPYVFNGVNYNATGTFTDTVTSTTGGCDTIYTINLTVSNLFTKTITPTICANQVPYVFNGVNYNATGTFTDTVTSTTGGCDTIYTINLTESNLFTKTITPTVCANQLPYVFNGVNYNATGTFTDTVTSTTGGCDTIYTINLTESNLFTKTITPTVCANQLPYVFNGVNYNTAGTFTDTVTSTTGGCDTIYTIQLTIPALFTKTITPTVCANQLPYVFNGVNYNTAGTFTDTVTSTTGGCDTIYTIQLTIPALFTKTITPTVCANQLPYVFNGVNYNTAGTFTDTVTSTTGGCDTIYTIQLTIPALFTKTITPTVCANQLPYVFNGVNYNTAGTFTDTVTSTTGGCDTIYTIQLTIPALFTKTITPTVCANQLPYVFNRVNDNTAGTFTDTVTSTTGGCDTIYTIQLTIPALFTKTITPTVCAN